ncbi:YhcN/YlaJ family sporulation lipoprotein [Alteribacter aurantiacus]|uniref:YhcN/YlaJ family sporulation lipoprotein n=1 Tax=Alteribacter aurantiacus TaxID=254410 RepID=UPI000425322E|nr:YhcN/YlaJ family sporulation lipoprotein [Alteribacter aurantiacus]
MKKWFMSLTAAVMLVVGLTGCGGDMNEEGDQEGFFTRGYNNRTTGQDAGYMNRRQGMTGSYYGQNYGYKNYGMNRGRETERYGNRAANYGNPMTGYKTRARGTDGRNTGFLGMNRRGGMQGQGRGIVGNDRAGYVDNNGVLNRFQARGNRLGGYDNHQRFSTKNQRGLGNRYSGYYDGEEGHKARRIANRVEDMDNVDDCRVIVNGNDVVVGLDTHGDSQRTEQKVRKLVSNMDDDFDVYVVTDREQLDQVRTMDDRLRAGEPFEEVGATFNDMVQDLGRAIQRPFQRSR